MLPINLRISFSLCDLANSSTNSIANKGFSVCETDDAAEEADDEDAISADAVEDAEAEIDVDGTAEDVRSPPK
jgi:hypothetical protein